MMEGSSSEWSLGINGGCIDSELMVVSSYVFFPSDDVLQLLSMVNGEG